MHAVLDLGLRRLRDDDNGLASSSFLIHTFTTLRRARQTSDVGMFVMVQCLPFENQQSLIHGVNWYFSIHTERF